MLMIEERRGERWDESSPALQTPNSQGTSGLIDILPPLGADNNPPLSRRHRTSSEDCRHRQYPQPKCHTTNQSPSLTRSQAEERLVTLGPRCRTRGRPVGLPPT